jgi:hypothetical protein
MNLNELAAVCHAANKKWWQDVKTGEPIMRNKDELLMLIITELSEAVEGERKNLMDDKLPHRKMAEVEMADAFIRILDFAAGFQIELKEDISLLVILTPRNKGSAIFDIVRCIVEAGMLDCGYYLSVAIARIQSYCDCHHYDLMGAFHEKMAFNATRADHTHEARRIAGGKQF